VVRLTLMKGFLELLFLIAAIVNLIAFLVSWGFFFFGVCVLVQLQYLVD
jgi:uncharacterized membrane protein